MSALPVPESSDGQAAPRQAALPSGRTVVLHAEGPREEIEVRSPAGQLELRIALTPEGPVLTLRGVRLQIDSTDTVAVNCRQFSLRTSDGLQLEAGGDMCVRSAGDAHIDGKMLLLNCGDRTGYPDPTPGNGIELPAPAKPARPTS